MLSFGDKFISSHLNIFIEKITPKDLLLILRIHHLRMYESIAEYCLSDELEILIVEEYIVIV